MARNPVRIKLKQKQRESLERKRKTERNRAVARRATIILLSDDEYPVEDICAATGVSAGTVTNTRKRWVREGFKGLADKPHPGRPPKADGEYLAKLMYVVGLSPVEFGYAFSVWTTPRLAEHLKRDTGTSLTPAYVSTLLRSFGYVWGRPKHTLKGKRDEETYKEGKERLRLLKKGRNAKTPLMNSSSSMKPGSTSTRTWLVCGAAAAMK